MTSLLLLFLALPFVSTSPTTIASAQSYTDEDEPVAEYTSFGPLTNDFQAFLTKNNLEHFDFPRRADGKNGSFGGRTFAGERIERIPVIFIHGNADAALLSNNFSTGWDESIREFMRHGYTMKELYGTSWGNTVAAEAISRFHSCNEILRLRAFIKAVLEYTKSPKVSIVTHSMGTTLIRKAIQGGVIHEPEGGKCKIRNSLVSKIDVFVGISSANAGLCWCAGPGANFPTCNAKNGFFVTSECNEQPATECSRHMCSAAERSDLLTELTEKDAHRVYSIWSTGDELIGGGGMVWGVQTHLVPHSDGVKIFGDLTHMQTKEQSAREQYEMVTGRY